MARYFHLTCGTTTRLDYMNYHMHNHNHGRLSQAKLNST